MSKTGYTCSGLFVSYFISIQVHATLCDTGISATMVLYSHRGAPLTTRIHWSALQPFLSKTVQEKTAVRTAFVEQTMVHMYLSTRLNVVLFLQLPFCSYLCYKFIGAPHIQFCCVCFKSVKKIHKSIKLHICIDSVSLLILRPRVGRSWWEMNGHH